MPQDKFSRRTVLLAWASAAVFVACVLFVVPYMASGTEMVRVRNALALVGSGPASEFSWEPGSLPTDFRTETGLPYPYFAALSSKLRLSESTSDWDRARTISEHLLSHSTLDGVPIQSDLVETHRRITEKGDGYCGDHTRVFMAMAVAAGLKIRAWGFSFDGFGGHGHVLPEVWNSQLGRWQLIDTYSNTYFHLGDGVALSAAEFRDRLAHSPATLRFSRLSPMARIGYPIESKMWDYYRRGLPEWYMVWGSDVFSYDRAIQSYGLGRFSRSLEQFAAVLAGDLPGVKLLSTPANTAQVQALADLRARLHVVFVVAVASFLVLLTTLSILLARRRFRLNPS